ncbi:4752_t:CDS:2 [Racocetra fulgida]|uniref:4752_t:CDS:1 n=1 Tax=Racocetra fulgida TaxID=60492 RepID=A0A9N9B3K0_9GLOM|nr:4752_t:CDS:2 [Racocetra fulgida]
MREVKVGETVLDINNDSPPLAGYQESKPNVYSNLYPGDSSQYKEFEKALVELQVQDSSLSLEKIDSQLLGPGFRCGFLGLLHREIICERMQKEYQCEIIITPPSIIYRITYQNGKTAEIINPQKVLPNQKIKLIEELFISCLITTPLEYLGAISQLCQNKRGVYLLLNKQIVADLSFFVHENFAYERARLLCEKLKTTLNPQNFVVPIQACIGNKIIARETLPALKKNVTAKLYAKQKSGKKRMQERGEVRLGAGTLRAILRNSSYK